MIQNHLNEKASAKKMHLKKKRFSEYEQLFLMVALNISNPFLYGSCDWFLANSLPFDIICIKSLGEVHIYNYDNIGFYDHIANN